MCSFKKKHFSVLTVPLFFTIGCWTVISPATAQTTSSKFETGEEVKVSTFHGWQDGKILEKKGSGWIVEWSFIEGRFDSRDFFTRQQIRKLCEENAIDYVRVWESSDKKFKIEAALKSVSGDGTEVTLVKVDLDEIKVKIQKLSDKDQAHIKKVKDVFAKEAEKGNVPAIIPELPPRMEFDGSDSLTTDEIAGETNEPRKLEPVPAFLKTFAQSGFTFNSFRPRQEYVAIIPVGGPDQLVLLTAKNPPDMRQEISFQSQGYWISLKQKKLLGTCSVTPGSLPVDYDPRHKLLLTVMNEWEGERQNFFKTGKMPEMGMRELGELVVWRVPPGGKDAVPLFCWGSPIDFNVFKTPFARIINEKIVLAKTGNDTYTAWNLTDKRVAYTLQNRIEIVLTNDRKTLIAPEGNRVLIINAENGQIIFHISTNKESITGANVDHSGKRLAAITNQAIFVWDLEKSADQEPLEFPAPLIGNPFGTEIEWIDDDHILVNAINRKVLYRLSAKAPIWSYVVERGAAVRMNESLSRMVEGMYVYLAEDQEGSSENFMRTMGRSSNERLVVGAVRFPGPKVMEISEGATEQDAESMFALKPGVHVDLALDTVENPESVMETLKEKIEEAGWVYQEGSTIKVIAKMGVLPTQQVDYRQFGSVRNQATTTVSFTPHYAFVAVTDGERILWKAASNTSPPFHVFGKGDLQAEIDRMQVPQSDFFERFKFIPRVLDPEYANGFGLSTIGLKGIVVQSVTPPGRADDPYKAAEDFESENRKEYEEREKNSQGDAPRQPDSSTGTGKK